MFIQADNLIYTWHGQDRNTRASLSPNPWRKKLTSLYVYICELLRFPNWGILKYVIITQHQR